jgi:hypothetical protein
MRLDIKSYKGGKQNLHVNRPGLRARANTVTILNFDQNLKSNKETRLAGSHNKRNTITSKSNTLTRWEYHHT